MRRIVDEAKFLQFIELAILAYGKGNRRLFGFSMEQIDLTDQNKVLSALYNMYLKGIYTRDEDGLHISREYGLILERLQNAKTALVVEAYSSGLPVCCCYLGDDILISEVTAFKEDTVRFSFTNKTVFSDYLTETGYLPDIRTEEAEEDEVQGWVKTNEEQEEGENILLSIKSLDTASGECTRTVFITELLIGYRMRMLLAGENYIWRFSPSNFRIMISELLGG